MARITVEDCLQNVRNRFELVILAAKRARQLMRGSADPTVPWENDKPTVVALREIAGGHTNFTDVQEETPFLQANEIHTLPGLPSANHNETTLSSEPESNPASASDSSAAQQE